MIDPERLVLDANILLRAVGGPRVRTLLHTYSKRVAFYSPDRCFEEARKHIPTLVARHRDLDLAAGMRGLDRLEEMIEVVESDVYEEHEREARARIAARDISDWPIVAAALSLKCPIWTEDHDFFGCGVATWTTNNVEIYLKGTKT